MLRFRSRRFPESAVEKFLGKVTAHLISLSGDNFVEQNPLYLIFMEFEVGQIDLHPVHGTPLFPPARRRLEGIILGLPIGRVWPLRAGRFWKEFPRLIPPQTPGVCSRVFPFAGDNLIGTPFFWVWAFKGGILNLGAPFLSKFPFGPSLEVCWGRGKRFSPFPLEIRPREREKGKLLSWGKKTPGLGKFWNPGGKI